MATQNVLLDESFSETAESARTAQFRELLRLLVKAQKAQRLYDMDGLATMVLKYEPEVARLCSTLLDRLREPERLARFLTKEIRAPTLDTLVRRGRQELAVVVESNPSPDAIHQPKVRIVTDIHKNLVPPSLIDLTHPSQSERHILHCVNPEK